eukprot:TRINITY_DN23122_c0_g3_i1.p1 TRINITY_DN23122_c0_g3~~TRINITY_DN23122_c0_g3_i1.p1  ORF type:complete len:305 (-),score=92.93 TRINITY_DN23122_c0_g3_i1:44-886(-)
MAAALRRLKDSDLDVPERWLLPEAPELESRLRRRSALLASERELREAARRGISQQAEVLLSSLDVPAIRALLRFAELAGAAGGAVERLRARCAALEAQVNLMEALRRDDAAAVAAARQQGLLPRSAAAADGTAAAVGAASGTSGDVAAWLHPDGPQTAAHAAVQQRHQLRGDEDLGIAFRAGDLEWQMRILGSLLLPSVRAIAGEAAAAALQERCRQLRAELPQRRALRAQLVADWEGPRALRRALQTAEAAGLGEPAAWLLPEGPHLLAAARQRLRAAE